MPATDVETLQLRIEATATKFEKDMDRAVKILDKAAKQMESRSAQTAKVIEQKFSGLGTSAAAGLTKFGIAAFAAVGGVSAISAEISRLAGISDASQKIGIGTEQLQALQFAAKQSASSTEEMTNALIFFSKELGQTNDKSSQLRKLFEANGVALRDSKGQLLPFTDLLVKYAQLVSNAATAQDKAAASVIGFGRSGANLIPVLDDIKNGMGSIEQAARDAAVVVDDDVIKAAERFDDKVSAVIDSAKAKVDNLIGAFLKLAEAIGKATANPGDIPPVGDPATGFAPGSVPLQPGSAPRFRTGGSFGAEPQTASTSTTIIPPSGGGGGGTKTENDYQRETKAIKDKINALELEAATLGLSTKDREAAEAALRLENAARDAGIKLTDDQKRALQALAAEYGNAAAAAEAAKKAQEELVKSADEFRSTASSALSGFVNDIRTGTSAAEAFSKVLDNLASKIVDALANRAIAALLGPSGTALGGSAGGGISSILAAFTGRAGGGPVNAGQPYRVGENGPETFVPKTAGRIVPAGGGGGVSVVTTIDARGADPAAIRRLEARLAERDRELPGAIERVVKSKRVRGQL